MNAYLNKINAPDKSNFRYAFTDLNAKITHKFSDKNVLSANFYTGNDVFKFLTDDSSQYVVGGEKEDRREVLDINLGWGNMVGSLNWKYDVSDKFSMSNKLYYSGSFSGFGYKEENTINDSYDMVGVYYNNKVHTIGLKSDIFHSLNSKHRLRYGATAQLHYYRPDYVSEVEERNSYESFKANPYVDSLKYKLIF